ncbi:MAG: leucine-rich repeat protein [Oscillospiraceae bacterium]|jgi:hypothetical protein|nr:leucine-rich repeat protein [Oscillospiraceae bacterium]
MKKIISIGLVAVLILTAAIASVTVAFAIDAPPFNPVSGNDWDLVRVGDDESTEVYVYAYMGDDTEVVVPHYISKFEVIGINDDFTYNTKLYNPGVELTSITMGDNIQYIGDHAFASSKLESVVLPKYLNHLGDFAFAYCENLVSVDFSRLFNLTTIPQLCFYECTALKSVYIDSSVTTLARQSFQGCTALEDIYLGNKITQPATTVFYKCSNLKSAWLGSSITSIGFLKRSSYSCVGENFEEIHIMNTQTEMVSGILDPAFDGLTIYGWRNSTANTYATENNINFVPLNPEPTTVPPTTVTEPPVTTPAPTTTVTEPPVTTTVAPTTITEPPVTTTFAPVYYILGDFNNDGKVNIADVTKIQKALAKLEPMTDYQKVIANVDGKNDDGGYYSGNLTIEDATEIQKYLAFLPANSEIGQRVITFGDAVR